MQLPGNSKVNTKSSHLCYIIELNYIMQRASSLKPQKCFGLCFTQGICFQVAEIPSEPHLSRKQCYQNLSKYNQI